MLRHLLRPAVTTRLIELLRPDSRHDTTVLDFGAAPMKKSLICATLILLVACDRKSISGPPSLVESALDIELRQSIGNWGVVPIGPMPVQSAALVSLGTGIGPI